MDKLSDFIVINYCFVLKHVVSPNTILYYKYYDNYTHKLVCTESINGASRFDTIDDVKYEQDKIYRLFKFDFQIERI